MGVGSSRSGKAVHTEDSLLLSGGTADETMFKSSNIHKGLANPRGENNCFLNVSVQALWHVNCFREHLKERIDLVLLESDFSRTALERQNSNQSNTSAKSAESGHTIRSGSTDVSLSDNVCTDGTTKSDKSTLPYSDEEEEEEGSDKEEETSDILSVVCNLFIQYEFTDMDVLPPTELRQTLQYISDKFKLGEHADANEALLVILESIHNESELCSSGVQKCLSHSVFGGLLMEQTFCSACYATGEPKVRQDFLHYLNMSEAIRVSQQHHRQENRSKANHLSFGLLLRKCLGVTAMACPSEDDTPPPRPACVKRADVRAFCLEPPLALALAITQADERESRQNLIAFYRLISNRIHLNEIFLVGRDGDSEELENHREVGNRGDRNAQSRDVSKRQSYLFRGMVCYYGKHYISIFQESSNGGKGVPHFLLFDDQNIRALGGWDDVVDEAVKSMYQPVLLLYELSRE